MNQDQALNILRTVLQIVGTLLVGHSIFGVTAADWTTLTGAILMAFPAIWGIVSRTESSMKNSVAALPNTLVVHTDDAEGTAKKVAAMSEVSSVVTNTKVAEAVPSVKVVDKYPPDPAP